MNPWRDGSFIVLWLGLLACGGDAASLRSPAVGDEAEPGGQAGARGGATVESVTEGEPGVLPSASLDVVEIALGGSPSTDVVALGVLEMLQLHCGECHSTGDNGDGFSGGLELGALIEHGMIVPGSSAESPILQRIVDGSMPPRVMRGGPTAGDLALLARFIDRLRAEAPPSCERLPFLDLDAAFAAMLEDVRSRPAAERPYLRYLGVNSASNAGLCGAALDQQRHALFKVINGVSTASAIHVPIAIDDNQLLYRVDIRDYGWDRPIDLEDDGVVDHADAWLAIAATARSHAVEMAGPEASELALETAAAVSFLPVNAFVHAVSAGDLYYALIGGPRNVYDAELALGIDRAAALIDGVARRAGFSRDVGERYDDVLVTRVPQGAFPERSYWTMEIEDQPGSSSIYSDPLGLSFGSGSWTLFELPNGLHAYSVNSADGARLGEIPLGCVGDCSRPERGNPVACLGCHAGGLLPVVDSVRQYVERNAVQFDAETLSGVLEMYPPASELEQLILQDNERYLAALEQAGVPRGLPDPVSRVFLQFETDPLDLERAAGELGVTAAALRAALGQLPAALDELAGPSASVDRFSFNDAFIEALCTLHAGARNRPASCP